VRRPLEPRGKSKHEATEKLVLWRNDVGLFALELFGFVPDPWQREAFDAWDRGDQRIAFQACKGPGKTAILAILIWHFLTTRPFAKVAATSISGDNLADCLWTELATWQQKSPLLLRTFEWTKTRIECRDHRETWWASARTWSRTANAETLGQTLAGFHGEYMLFVLDETGGMPEAIAVAADAALSTGVEVRMVQAGNPLQCDGPLWKAAKKERHLWTVIEITGDPDDPRRSPRISVEWARAQIESHGRDNPWVMANVFGKFPSASPLNFIPAGLIEEARKREALAQMTDPLVIGVDVARFGDDKTVIRIRKGRDARTHPPIKLRNQDNLQVATRVAQLARDMQADAVFVDGGGNGGGVIDILRGVLHVPHVIEVQFGASAPKVNVNPEIRRVP
jgi:phage terminase large subunit